MDSTALDYSLLATFVSVADETSFSKAAKRLGVTKGTVSRAIQKLEGIVGAELLHRTTHAVALSTAGTALYERVSPHLRGLREALGTLPEREQEPAGVLRVTAPTDFGTIVLPSIVAQFGLRYPAVRFDLLVTNTVVDLVAERIDIAIRPRVGRQHDASLAVRTLGRGGVAFYASPSYLARRGTPKEIADPRHDWVVMPAMRRFLFPNVKNFEPRVNANDLLTARELLVEGLGIGALPPFATEAAVADGTLVRVPLPLPPLPSASLGIVYAKSRTLPRKVVAFRDFLLEFAKTRRLDAP